MWKNDLVHGHGMINLPDGSMYIGDFKDGKKHGFGTYRNKKGDKHIGFWISNIKNGICREFFGGGVVQMWGVYKNGVK